jgi:hypothetical protein
LRLEKDLSQLNITCSPIVLKRFNPKGIKCKISNYSFINITLLWSEKQDLEDLTNVFLFNPKIWTKYYIQLVYFLKPIFNFCIQNKIYI